MSFDEEEVRDDDDEIDPEDYPTLKHHPDIRWGTYAIRLLRRTDPKGRKKSPEETELTVQNLVTFLVLHLTSDEQKSPEFCDSN